MCAACVAQGTAYVGVALGTLRVMGARAAMKRGTGGAAAPEADAAETVEAVEAGHAGRGV